MIRFQQWYHNKSKSLSRYELVNINEWHLFLKQLRTAAEEQADLLVKNGWIKDGFSRVEQ